MLYDFFIEAGFDIIHAGIPLNRDAGCGWGGWAVVCYNTRLNLDDRKDVGTRRALFKFRRQMQKKFGTSDHCCHLIFGDVAMEYINGNLTQYAANIREKIRDKRARYEPKDLSLRRLDGNGQRSRVDLILRGGKKYVRKLFYDGYEAYFQSEMAARREINDPAVAEVVERGRNYLVMPYYEDVVRWDPSGWRYYPLDKARKIMALVSGLNARGYALVDWHPETTLFDAKLGMKVVDFEFWRTCRPEPDFAKAADYMGRYEPYDDGRRALAKGGYRHFWYQALGVKYRDLMEGDDAAALRKQRLHFVLGKIPKKAGIAFQGLINRVRSGFWRVTHQVGAGHISGDSDKSSFSRLLTDEVLKGKRIVLFQPSDQGLIDAIAERGAGDIWSLSSWHDGLYERLSPVLAVGPYRRTADVRRNNGQTLFLGGAAPWAARRFRTIGHARYLCVPLSPMLATFLPALLRYGPRDALRYRGRITLPARRKLRRDWLVFENRHRKYRRGPKYYIDPFLSAEQIFERLSGLNYILLRWPGALDRLDALADLDLLVGDDDLAELVARLDRTTGARPVDLYSETGQSSHGFGGIAYYPPQMARALLDEAVTGPHGARVAKPDHAYLAFAYHLTFHKAPAETSRDASVGPGTWGAPRYHEELCRLAREAGSSEPRTIGDLEDTLKDAGWFPPRDCLSVYAKSNPYIAKTHGEAGNAPPGLSVFILREIADRHGLVKRIKREISAAGFEILASNAIAAEDRAAVSAATRGSNWSTPADREEEGGPAHFILAYDPSPLRLKGRRRRRRYPRVDNARVLVKRDIRRKLAKETGLAERQFNPMHASDNSSEALDYISVISPDLLSHAKNRIGSD